MKLLTIVLSMILAFTIANSKYDSILWLDPDGGEWITIDSLEEGFFKKAENYAKFGDVSCFDSLNWAVFTFDSYLINYALVRITRDGGLSWSTVYRDSVHLINSYQHFPLWMYNISYPE